MGLNSCYLIRTRTSKTEGISLSNELSVSNCGSDEFFELDYSMNVFDTHNRIVDDYSSYIRSFINISDDQIREKVESELREGKLWPDPLLQFNPAFEQAGSVEDLATKGLLHADAGRIFSGYSLYRHQVEAINLGAAEQDFVVTSGTGSGKSLTYIATIFDYLLRNPESVGVTAIVVYPMNALINSQTVELQRYRDNFRSSTGKGFPIDFGQYTGQEKEESRERMRETPPQILLTNYMMLELLLTRSQERRIRDAIFQNLRFLTFDELHTYRGRQGADVAMLIRRIQSQCIHPVTCIGTSATMVSIGNAQSQKEEVAEVARTVFGRPFQTDQIVNETLAPSLADGDVGLRPDALREAIATGIDVDAGESALRNHPVAVWLERNVALDEGSSGLRRRKPMTVREVVDALVAASGASEPECQTALIQMLLWISKVNQTIQTSGSKYTILPFKIHQFFAQTGSVYTTLESDPDRRFITLEPGLYKVDEKPRKPIYPNVFSRESGHPFICVTRTGDRLEPREFRIGTEEEDSISDDGYLIVGEDIWDPTSDLENLPDAWVRIRQNDRVPETKKAPYFPKKIFFNEYGLCSDTDDSLGSWGWFMKAPLLFDPTSGTFFDTRTNEGTKLTKLGSEGRSTSTTITAFSILNQLGDASYKLKDQKLLSFTDNRQDAALQSGHFNDFVQVIRLRSAIYHALQQADGNTLDYSNIGRAIFESLKLDFGEYSTSTAAESPFPHVRANTDETLQNFLFYRALADLRRSWRIVLPSLEQCALLKVTYKYLDEVSENNAAWSDVPVVRNLSVPERKEFLTVILDFFRYEQAIHSENFLKRDRLGEFEKRFREQLKSPWSLDEKERLTEPYVVRLDTLNRNVRLYSKSIGPTSSVGKYIKHFVKMHPNLDPDEVKGDSYRSFIEAALGKLEAADYLIRDMVNDQANRKVPVFRLKINHIQWQLGDGENVRPDVVKRRSYKGSTPRPNFFFRDLYKRDFSTSKRFVAAEHTGQLGVAQRQDREERFRADWDDEVRVRRESISALFCSPTMELGVDIGGLSVVHLRNAPPNPANYAQRSGRAGRSGQGALIFTYCSSYSPHDRHYFQQQPELVAGIVRAPRIDLTNKELLLTHLHALVISEVGLPGLDTMPGQAPSLMSLVDPNAADFPLLPGVRAGLKLGPETQARLKATFERSIQQFSDKLKLQDWFNDGWIDHNIETIADKLDESLARWRDLYASARELLSRATQRIETGLLVVGSDEFKKYKRLQDQANRQLNLLRNDHQQFGDLSEFYPFRYLASEGFLPGYNFTRLPIRVFVPSSSSGGEFISRPRNLGLREFGPLNVLYHSGNKYQIAQMVVQEAESKLEEAVVSKKSGYFLKKSEMALENCPFSNESLHDNANKIIFHDLLELTESRAEPVDRISCEEEERVSKGFEINTYFSVDGGDMTRVQKASVLSTESHLLNLRYVPSARLHHINTKWRAQKIEGFPIGLMSGDWRSSMPEIDDRRQHDEFKLVRLYTSNVADALYIEPIAGLGLKTDGVITLQYAIKRAIEEVFQVEPNEIGVMTVGDDEAPNILLFEAAEANLGVLSQFVEKPEVFAKVIEVAESICKFDEQNYKAPASYNDLLSYYNQRNHSVIDRFLIQDALQKLKISKVEIQSSRSFANYDEHYKYMMENLDQNSSTEKVFIEHLYKSGLRLPDFAQKQVDGIYCQPDFYYDSTPPVWIFCDGTPHDDPEVRQRDHDQRQLIIGRGEQVWFWHYKEDLAEKVAQRPDIFSKIR